MGNNTVTGFKMTDKFGSAFYSKRREHQLEKGKSIVAEDFDPNPQIGNGLHFSGEIDQVVNDGTAAALSWDYNHGDSRSVHFTSDNVMNNSPSRLLQDGVKIFKVQAEETVKIPHSTKMKAKTLTATEEIPLHTFADKFAETNNWTALALTAASSPPGIVEGLMKTLPQQSKDPKKVTDALKTGWMLTKNNPDRVKPGNRVTFGEGENTSEGTVVGFGRTEMGYIAVDVGGQRKEMKVTDVQKTGEHDDKIDQKYHDDPRSVRSSLGTSARLAAAAQSPSDGVLGKVAGWLVRT